jgi:hypothetical protein
MTIFRISILSAFAVITSCATSTRDSDFNQLPVRRVQPVFENSFTLPMQQTPPPTIRSIEFFRGSAGQPPIFSLNSSEQLTLRFDEIRNETRPFRVTITHHNANWSLSSLMPDTYIRGFQEDHIQSGSPSRLQSPTYFSYEYTFPNRDMRVTRSGNYLMHIHDGITGQILFSMPFLVVEPEGSLSVDILELFNLDPRYLRHHQPFARYTYDDTSIIPQTDYSILFVQNQFWSKARKADQLDFSEATVARMYLSRERAFVGTFEFLDLNLSNIDQYSFQIVDFRTDMQLPSVTLTRDVVNLAFSPQLRSINRLSNPSLRPEARYALVNFNLEVAENERTNNPVYIVGGFNNWAIDEFSRMHYRPETGLYTGNAVIKEGTYTYKYVTRTGNRIDDLRFDASFASTRQEYHTLVYRRDFADQTDRLVAVDRQFTSN